MDLTRLGVASRFDPKALNKRALETLSMAGAFDVLERNRALVNGNVDQLMGIAGKKAADKADGMQDFFGGGGGLGADLLKLRPVRAWTPMERLQHEFSAVGFYLSGHPLDDYMKPLQKLSVDTYAGFHEKALTKGARAAKLAGTKAIGRKCRCGRGGHERILHAYYTLAVKRGTRDFETG